MPEPKYDIPAFIDECYRVSDLKAFLGFYGPALSAAAPAHFKNLDKIQALPKKALIPEFANVFTNRENFNIFLSVLDDPVRGVLEHLVWERGPFPVGLLAERHHAAFLLARDQKRFPYFRPSEHIDPKYRIFRFQEDYAYRFDPHQHFFAFIPDPMRTLFKQYLPPPPGYRLEFLDRIEKTAFNFRDQGRIIGDLDLILAYIRQGHLKMSKSGNKVLVKSLKEMTAYCNIEEFYPSGESDIKFMRTNLMSGFILDSVIPDVPDPIHRFKGLILKQLFETATRSTRFRFRDLLTHLNGVPSFEMGYAESSLNEAEDRVRGNIFDLFDRLSEERWVSMENLYTHCLFREKDFEILDRSYAARYLSFSKEPDAEDRHYYSSAREQIRNHLYGPALLAPLIKGVMFLAAAFGLVDIAYDPPENRPSLRRKGKPYLSVFDGLRHVRLSELGAYVFGKTGTYSVAVDTSAARLTLDDRRLLITIEGDDKLKLLALEKVGERIGDTSFRVTHDSFLKECANKADIQRKIALFKDQISNDPPPLWTAFMKEIEARINPIARADEMVLYKLKSDPELISLVASDPVLKAHVLKAEDYHIAIRAKHYRTVRDRLASFGYFMEV